MTGDSGGNHHHHQQHEQDEEDEIGDEEEEEEDGDQDDEDGEDENEMNSSIFLTREVSGESISFFFMKERGKKQTRIILVIVIPLSSPFSP